MFRICGKGNLGVSLGLERYDAVIVGSGPNGLAAAVFLASQKKKVLVVEARDEIGGGTRTAELTLPGFKHDVCSGAHPMGILSPYFTKLPLKDYGLDWVIPPASVAHPLDHEPAILLTKSLEITARHLKEDQGRYTSLLNPFVKKGKILLEDALAPLGFPKDPFLLARFGLRGIRSAVSLANSVFKTERAKALLAGCAAHSILPLNRSLSSAVGLLFLVTAHLENWPVVRGGSFAISTALANYFKVLGGDIELSRPIKTLDDLPPAKVILFDTDPIQMANISGQNLPEAYKKRLRNYRYGPGVFKVDWALDGPIPWKDDQCLQASTVHLGGSIEEIAEAEGAIWNGKHPDKPFVLLVQQSQFDSSRAPRGKHTGYAYCHVPNGSTKDYTKEIEQQIERFAPGFQDIILARHKMNTEFFESYNANYVGGAITGGVADLFQTFNRPVTRLNPYATPNPKIFICSASSPPGGGVHGMCGYYAARSALKRIG